MEEIKVLQLVVLVESVFCIVIILLPFKGTLVSNTYFLFNMGMKSFFEYRVVKLLS